MSCYQYLNCIISSKVKLGNMESKTGELYIRIDEY